MMTFALACGRDSLSGPNGATLTGSVELQDTWGNDLTDFSGIDVGIDGLSLHGVTGANGAWRIDDVPPGHHDITLKKASVGTMRVFGQDVQSPTTVVPNVSMAVTPTGQALIDSIYVAKMGGISFYMIDGHLTSPPPPGAKLGTTVIFLGRSADVSPSLNEQWNASFDISGTLSTFTVPLSVDGTRATFGAGTQLFVTGYAYSAACSCYDDPATKKRVFTNTGPRGNVVRLTVQ
jgi:hypothetical protein